MKEKAFNVLDFVVGGQDEDARQCWWSVHGLAILRPPNL